MLHQPEAPSAPPGYVRTAAVGRPFSFASATLLAMADAIDSLRANAGWWLELRCICDRIALLPVAVLAERHGPAARLPALMALMRCQGAAARR